MELVLSTSWNAYRHEDADRMIFEIKELGFRRIELSFNLTSDMVRLIGQAVKKAEIEVTSLHNFCPIPFGVKRSAALPDHYSMASLDEAERALAVRQTKTTIETAASLGASAVVLHCGMVEMDDKMSSLVKMYSAGLKDTSEFLALRSSVEADRKARAKAHFESALKSLEELEAYARSMNVLLGAETRFYFREIPSYQEIGGILERFKSSNIGYWHDIGHAQVMENLGFSLHKEYLESYCGRLIGMHIHDLTGCSDHKAPGSGEFDFTKVLPYLRKDTIKVIEAHRSATAAEIKAGIKLLENNLYAES